MEEVVAVVEGFSGVEVSAEMLAIVRVARMYDEMTNSRTARSCFSTLLLPWLRLVVLVWFGFFTVVILGLQFFFFFRFWFGSSAVLLLLSLLTVSAFLPGFCRSISLH